MSIESLQPERRAAHHAGKSGRGRPDNVEVYLSLWRVLRRWHVGKGDLENPGDLVRVRREPQRVAHPENGGGCNGAAGVGVLHSSEEIPETGVERRRGSCA